jgi:hypothetical protein
MNVNGVCVRSLPHPHVIATSPRAIGSPTAGGNRAGGYGARCGFILLARALLVTFVGGWGGEGSIIDGVAVGNSEI